MAKIILNVEVNYRSALKDVEELKKQFTNVAEALSKVKVDKNLVDGIKNLTNHYTQLAKAASSVINIEEKLAKAREKTAQEALKTAQQEEKLNQQQIRTASEKERLTQQLLKTESQKEKLERDIIRTEEAREKQERRNIQTMQEHNARALVLYTSLVKVKEAMLPIPAEAAQMGQGLETLNVNLMTATDANMMFAQQIDKTFGAASRYLIRMFVREVRELLSDLSETLQETENRVIELQRVIRDDVANSEVSDKLYDLAKKYGQTFENAAELAGNFARAGYSWADSLKATESALLAMNVAELNAEQASEGLIAVMTQFKLDASDLELVIDKLNKTADENPVTTEKLLKALQRAGSAAVNANLSLDKTVGLITTLSKATARSGQNLGTAVNALIMYTQKAKSLEVFASLSEDVAKVVDDFKVGAADIVDIWEAAAVELKKLQEEKGTLSSALDAFADTEGMEELNSTLHDELEDIYDQTIGLYNVANTYRKNYFIALLDNMDKVQQVQDNLVDAQGYSQEENLKYMESYTAKVNSLKAEWEKLLNDEQGFLEFRKSLVEIGSKLIDIIKHTGGLSAHIIQITTLVTGLILFIKAEKIGTVVTDIFKSLKAGVEVIKNLKFAVREVKTEEESATITAQKWGAALLALTLAITVINGISGAIQQARDDTIEAARNSRDYGTELAALYEQLNNAAQGSERWYEIEDQLVSVLGDKAESLQILTKHTEEYTTAVKNLTEAELANALAEQKASLAALEGNLDGGFTTRFAALPGNNGNLFAQYATKYYTGGTMNWGSGYTMSVAAANYATSLSATQLYDAYLSLQKDMTEKAREIYQAENEGRKKDADELQKQYNRMKDALNSVVDEMQEIGRVLGAISTIESAMTTSTASGRKKKISGVAKDITRGYDNLLPLTRAEEEVVESAGTVDNTDYYLEELKAAVTLRKSELTLMEYQGASTDELIAKHKEIQDALHNQAEYLRSIGADQSEINSLSSEWYSWQEKIEALIKKTYTDEISLIKSRLTLAEKQGEEYSERVGMMKDIQNNLHQEAEYLRKIGASETDINALSSEWWDWQEKILKLYQETLDTAKQLELDAIQKIIDSILNEIDLEEEQLTLAEKRLAVTEAQKKLEDAIAQAKLDYISSVLSEYITALSDAETLEEKQRAVSEARTKALNAQKEAQNKAIVEAMKAQRDSQSETLDLAEKQLAVEEARQRLAEAENNLTTRVFNEATGQWEYQANAKDVQSAQKALADAVQSLNDYLEGEAWDEILEGMENGSLSESEMLAILQKWANLSPDSVPGFVDSIAEAYRRAIGTSASPDSISSEVKAVNTAIDNLNDYLKNQAVKELQEYIKNGNSDIAGMQSILDKWLANGVGSEIYEWRDGLLSTLGKAINSNYYDHDKVKSAVEGVSTAVENLQKYLDTKFISDMKKLLTGGSAADMYALLMSARSSGEVSESMLNYGDRLASAKAQMEEIETAYGIGVTGSHTADEIASVKAKMMANSVAWNYADEEEKKRLAEVNFALGAAMGWTRKSNGAWYDTNGERIYDRGGVLNGMGGIKATSRPEIILDPDLTSKILAPQSEAQFKAFADAMHLMFERGDRMMASPAVSNYGGSSSVDSHNITINGVPISQAMAETHTIAELCRVLPLVNS